MMAAPARLSCTSFHLNTEHLGIAAIMLAPATYSSDICGLEHDISTMQACCHTFDLLILHMAIGAAKSADLN